MKTTLVQFMRLNFCAIVVSVVSVFGSFPHIPPKTWYKVPNSNLSAIFQTPSPIGSTPESVAVVSKDGGAFDTHGDRLIITGGELTSAGNKVYAFSIDSLKWLQLTPGPTTYDSTQHGWYINGGVWVPDKQQPRGGNHYDQVEYDSDQNSVYFFGKANSFPMGFNHSEIYQLKLDSSKWRQVSYMSSMPDWNFPGGSVSARDPATGKIWVFGNGSTGYMASFNPSNDSLKKHGSTSNGGAIPTFQTAAIMPPVNRMISVGSGSAKYWPIVTSGNSIHSSL